ncbi:conserved hypothetical protein [Desulfofarcimen acetoxidans DSM 771]|uniref:N-acetyltransferase domain-containing protein n=1 Tax=Desulfofarcimen acetoxidans (strain ATCC 49208 / DSM 771 / KCTC 5769 / VKM B-1644 / 5575) TaxID=485916 RepID=C8VW18_DESAS|nr:hypothetical protein [Desulfofarcimen acetoxidans]ACV64305.1 conserved hypothetical protein [Desulfofarcimen acetoxidans DSM 771]
MSIQVIEVSTGSELYKFIDLSRQIYKNDRWGVLPPMDSNLPNFFQSPYFRQHNKLYLALNNNRPVARAAAITNQDYMKNIGFIGYFEAFEEPEATASLFNAATSWLKECQVNTVIGPVTRNTNQIIGVLTEGFSEEPYFMTPYNSPYYSSLFDSMGFIKAEDFFAYRWNRDIAFPPKIHRVALKASRSSGLNVRSIRFNRINQEALAVKNILNQAMSNNWGYKPLSDLDAQQLLYEYKGFCDPDLMTVIEIGRQPAAICLTVPNINPLLNRFTRGLPLPLPYGLKQQLNTFRLAILGVVPDFRYRGLEAIMISRTINTALAKGYTSGEFSLIHERNTMMNKIISGTGCPKVKSFRLYQKEI